MATISETLVTAVQHHQAGDLPRAERMYRQLLRADPNQPDALHLLGVLAHQFGRHGEAVKKIRRAIAANPNVAAFHSNLGAAYNALRQLSEAAASYRRALRIEPNLAEVHNNLGNTLREQGKLDEAVASFQRALQVKSDYAEAHNNLGIALRDQGKLDDAAACYRRALQILPDYAEAHNNLGNVLRDQGQLGEAEAHYRRALHSKPGFADAYGNLAALCERLSRLEEARGVAEQGLRVSPAHPVINLAIAKCDARRGCHQEAIDRLLRISPHAKPDPEVAKEISLHLGRLYERVGNAAEAFARFTETNRLAGQIGGDHQAQGRLFDQNIQAYRTVFNETWINSWSAAPPLSAEETPVFLIGFARSGTTLLDVVLGSHPRIQTLEEKPTIDAVHSQIQRFPGPFARAVANLTPEQFGQLRAAYFHTVDELIDRDPARLLIDRNPMNTVEVGIILRVFPAARFIVAVRHPYDVCLSCFMQDFNVNRATAHFLSLEGAARLYADVMNLWQQYVRVLPHRYHLVRYEDLVDDFRGQTRRLLQFLELEWDDAVLDYDEHARQREVINTPSYNQVTKPIYRHARYRWQRYAEYLQPVMELLQPYVEFFGYERVTGGGSFP